VVTYDIINKTSVFLTAPRKSLISQGDCGRVMKNCTSCLLRGSSPLCGGAFQIHCSLAG